MRYRCFYAAAEHYNPALRINFRKKIPRRAVPLLARFIRKNVVACAEKVLHNELRQYLDGHKFYRCLTSPAVFELNEILASAGLKVGYMSEYFLPDVSKMQAFCPLMTNLNCVGSDKRILLLCISPNGVMLFAANAKNLIFSHGRV